MHGTHSVPVEYIPDPHGLQLRPSGAGAYPGAQVAQTESSAVVQVSGLAQLAMSAQGPQTSAVQMGVVGWSEQSESVAHGTL